MTITVLIPIFNTNPAALLESVYSILEQDDGTPHPILLIDDGSTDQGTLKVIEMLCTSPYTNMHRIKSFRQENGGTSSALNYGHSLVQTEFVALQGSDDISDRSRFRLQLEYLKKNPKTDVLGTNLFSYQDKDIRRKPIFTTTHRQIAVGAASDKRWLVNHGTVMYRNQAVIDTGGYNLAFRRAQDVELWGRMVEKGYVFRNIESILYLWRRYK